MAFFLILIGAALLQRGRSFKDIFRITVNFRQERFFYFTVFVTFLYGVASVLDKIILTTLDPLSYIFVTHFICYD